jgi:hypothetical protein
MKASNTRSYVTYGAVCALAACGLGCDGAVGSGSLSDDGEDASTSQGGRDGGARPPTPHDEDAYAHDAPNGRDVGAHDTSVSDAGPTPYDSGAPGDDATPPTPAPGGCYSEIYYPTATLDDLVSGYSSSKWLDTSLETTKRRFPTGNFILMSEEADPQLASFADPSSFDALMESLMTMCHEETHGYDYEHAGAGNHAYVMRTDLIITVPVGSTFPRSEILSYITDDSTSLYDSTYLEGSMGSYDFADMNDELNAYTNGLACLASVAEHETGGISARDGAVAHLLYLELYLKRARTAHPDVYTFLQTDPDWMKYVKYAWARVFFWDAVAKPFPTLTIGADAIWAHVNDPANLDEIRKFTGREPSDVACHPEI